MNKNINDKITDQDRLEVAKTPINIYIHFNYKEKA